MKLKSIKEYTALRLIELYAGQKVVLVSNNYDYNLGTHNPKIGTSYQCVGEFDGCSKVKWENGKSNGYKDYDLAPYEGEDEDEDFDIEEAIDASGVSVIKCESGIESKRLFKILIKNGYKWRDGSRLSVNDTKFSIAKGSIYYTIEDGKKLYYGNNISEKSFIRFQDLFNGYVEPKATPSIKSDKKEKSQIKPETKGEKLMKKVTVESVVKNVKSAVNTTKDSLIDAQKGYAAITAIREGVMKSPLPASVRDLISTPVYGDFAIGVILDIVVPTLTISEEMLHIAKTANQMGSIELSKQFTMLQDIISSALKSVVPDMSKILDKKKK